MGLSKASGVVVPLELHHSHSQQDRKTADKFYRVPFVIAQIKYFSPPNYGLPQLSDEPDEPRVDPGAGPFFSFIHFSRGVTMSTPCKNLSLATAMFFLFCLSVEASDLMPERVGQSSYGVVNGFSGTPLLGTVTGERSPVTLGHRIAVGQGLQTGHDESLEILWDRHAIIYILPQSTVMIQEPKPGQTEITLTGGSLRVAVPYGGRPMDMLTVLTPSSRVYTRGGILEVDVRPPSLSLLSRVTSVIVPSDAAKNPALVETVRVVEGQSGTEPFAPSSPEQSNLLEAGVQATIARGIVQQLSDLPPRTTKGMGLAETDRGQATPGLLTQRLASVHLTHAVWVARLMSEASSADKQDTLPDADLKGTHHCFDQFRYI